MKTIVSGVVSFFAIGVAWALLILPFTFNLVSGLVPEDKTLGTILGLAACVIVGYIGLQLAILFAFLIGAVIGFVTRELD